MNITKGTPAELALVQELLVAPGCVCKVVWIHSEVDEQGREGRLAGWVWELLCGRPSCIGIGINGPGFLKRIACSKNLWSDKICVVAQRSDLLTMALRADHLVFNWYYIKSCQFQTGPKIMNFQIPTLARPFFASSYLSEPSFLFQILTPVDHSLSAADSRG